MIQLMDGKPTQMAVRTVIAYLVQRTHDGWHCFSIAKPSLHQ